MIEAFKNKENLEKLEEIKKDFIEGLNNPYKNSYLKNLKRIMGAFILAGIMVFLPGTAITPEKSKQLADYEEIVAILNSNSVKTKDFDKYIEKLDQIANVLKEKGGIEFSPQLPKTVFKPYFISRKMEKSLSDKNPYFSRPEIVLGEDFVKKNPEKAKNYMEKISETMKSTVIVENKDMGSLATGAIINTKKGKFILTNQHAVEDGKNLSISLINNQKFNVEVIKDDPDYDLALLKINIPKGKEHAFNDTSSLDIDFDFKYEKEKKIAFVGHPLGCYPFEVALAKLPGEVSIDSDGLSSRDLSQIKESILSFPDERFSSLAAFELPFHQKNERLLAIKGESIEGMSGGPMISLEDEGRAKLIGLTYGYAFDSNRKILSLGINSKTISKFLGREFLF